MLSCDSNSGTFHWKDFFFGGHLGVIIFFWLSASLARICHITHMKLRNSGVIIKKVKELPGKRNVSSSSTTRVSETVTGKHFTDSIILILISVWNVNKVAVYSRLQYYAPVLYCFLLWLPLWWIMIKIMETLSTLRYETRF